MAKTIGQLTSATTIGNSDLFVIEQASQTKKVAASVVRGGLVNADVDAAAAIAFSKLAALDSANILVGNGSNVATKVAVTGDVTISNAGVTAIGNDKVVTATILDANVTTAKVADAAITAPKLSGAQTGSAPIYGCRAWVNFDGTAYANVGGEDQCTINGSGNVTKAVRNGLGDYTVNFTTAMPNANYAVSFGVNGGSSPVVASMVASGAGSAPSVKSTTQVRFKTEASDTGTDADVKNISVIVVA